MRVGGHKGETDVFQESQVFDSRPFFSIYAVIGDILRLLQRETGRPRVDLLIRLRDRPIYLKITREVRDGFGASWLRLS